MIYDLQGAICHRGASLDSGHYWDWSLDPNGGDGWLKFDDDRVTKSQNWYEPTNAFVLQYQKRVPNKAQRAKKK